MNPQPFVANDLFLMAFLWFGTVVMVGTCFYVVYLLGDFFWKALSADREPWDSPGSPPD